MTIGGRGTGRGQRRGIGSVVRVPSENPVLRRKIPALYRVLCQTDMFNRYSVPVELMVMIISNLYRVETKLVHRYIVTEDSDIKF